ncbi:hypothetical protein Q7A53_14920 [Halobacillus rhizosphaerae]|uniref:hypothetical protein n=1 Tax=Halobacillus rhizosphaerae TaxID=3064889 RepID=UPI00398B1043
MSIIQGFTVQHPSHFDAAATVAAALAARRMRQLRKFVIDLIAAAPAATTPAMLFYGMNRSKIVLPMLKGNFSLKQ